ncbi:MAG: NTP transferase domain-containing protein [Myxococcales bacterium]|nr:NTP transferase domain-containing protein [Myxococcales bacterium]
MSEGLAHLDRGALIAGGHARRMGGQPKGLIPLPDGSTPVQRALATLQAVCPGGVVLVGRADHPYSALDLRTVPDGMADRGAPGGVLGALTGADGWVAVLPVDLPHVGPDLLLDLLPHRAGHATLWQADGQLQPLVGWWHASAHAPLHRILTEGAPGFRRIVGLLGDVTVVDHPDPARFHNLNRPEDLAVLRAGGR